MSTSTVKPIEETQVQNQVMLNCDLNHLCLPCSTIKDEDTEELEGKRKLKKWLNVNFRIEMTDGRVLIGVFLCTDRDANVILGACSEYLKTVDGQTEEPRVLGLVMVPGRHIVSIQIDDTTPQQKYYYDE